MEMMPFRLSEHPIWGRVLARHRRARGVGFADDLNIYAFLKTALKVLVEMRQRLGEDAKLSFNMTKVKIYIPGVTRERARERVLQHIEHDPSRVCPLAHPNLSTRSCAPRPMPLSKMFKSFASSRTQKSITICCDSVNTHALHFSPETCLLTS